MSNLVIVAIPDENDRVWKVSSEKVPHLTLLFLGEADRIQNVDKIAEFVEHAANTTLKRFYLPVDRRGELGDDPETGPADVLFFKKSRYDFKAIRDFRSALLRDTNIKTAVDSVDQYETWTPHLTLGYQNTPAKPDEHDHGFYDVSFTKIAIWTGDYEGPEFLLKDYWDEYEDLRDGDNCVAWGEERVPEQELEHEAMLGFARSCNALTEEEEFLEHYGVKGMKWGVRRYGATAVGVGAGAAGAVALGGTGVGLAGSVAYRVGVAHALHALDNKMAKSAGDRPPPDDRLPTGKDVGRGLKKAGKATAGVLKAVGAGMAESSWQNSVHSDAHHEAVHNEVAKTLDNRIGRLQTSPKYRGKNLRADADLRKEYYQDVAKVTDKAYKRAVKEHYGDNHYGDQTPVYVHDARGPRIEVRRKSNNEVLNESPLTSQVEIARRRRAAQESLSGVSHDALEHVADFPGSPPDLEIELVIDDDGFITGVGFLKPQALIGLQNGTRLADQDFGAESVAQTADLGAEFLEHHGVKGMKWGVRKARDAAGAISKAAAATPTKRERNAEVAVDLAKKAAPAAKAGAQATVKGARAVRFQTHKNSQSAITELIAEAALKTKYDDLPAINAKYKGTGVHTSKNVRVMPSPFKGKQKDYRNEVRDAYRKNLDAAAAKRLNHDGTRQYVIKDKIGAHNSPIRWKVSTQPVAKHAATDAVDLVAEDVEFTVEPKFDKDGFIIDIVHVPEEEAVAHTVEMGEEFLTHYGVKGMHWGVRKSGPAPAAVAPTATSKVAAGVKGKTKIETKGGEFHDAHPDAIKVAEARAKLVKSGPAALSNKELADLKKRMELEQQVGQLTQGKGKKFISGLLKQQGQQEVNARIQADRNRRMSGKR